MAHDDAAPAAWGAALDRWLDTLDREGLRTGVRERLQVQSLLARLAAGGQLPATLRETLALAAPLLCTSREQQRRYAALLAAFVADGSAAGGGPAAAAGSVDAGPAPRFGSVLAAVALVIALVLLPWAARRPAGLPAAADAASASVAAASAATLSPPMQNAPPRAVQAVYVPPLPLPLQPALPPAWAPPLRAVLLAAAALSALALAAVAVGRRRRALALQGLSADDDALDHHLLHDAAPVDVSPHPVLARAVARALRQRVAGEAQTLDTGATLRATVAAQGAFSPRWRQLQRTPEYLALVDTRHACDHHAAYAHTLLAALQRAGVSLHVFGYDTTPAAGCWAHGALGNDDIATRQRLPLATLVNRAGGSRLLVFGTADALLQPATGELQPWLASLRTLAERAWITPLPPHAWRADEQAADEAGFLVLPLQEAALPALAGWLTSRRATLALDADTPQSWPALLRGGGLAWVTRPDAPPADTVAQLLQQLRQMLGGIRFQWLCACAVFPALMPPLTLALGQRLLMPLALDQRLPTTPAADQPFPTAPASQQPLPTTPDDDQRASASNRSGQRRSTPPEAGGPPPADPRGLALGMAALSALPWFRHGRMPAWLRRELLQRLAPDLRAVLDAEVRRRLDTALSGGSGPLLADIATKKRRLLAALQRRRGPLRDVVLADFVRANTEPGLAQRLPEGLRRRLFNGGNPAAGWRASALALPAACVLAGAVAATPLWPALVGTVPQPALAVVQDVELAIASTAPQPIDELLLQALGDRFVGVLGAGTGLETAELGAGPAAPQSAGAASAPYATPALLLTPRDANSIVAATMAALPAANADGTAVVIDPNGGLHLARADGTALSAPLDTGGVAVVRAGFSASGSRVLALLSSGRLRVWGRPWESVQIEVLTCAAWDPAERLAGDATRLIAGFGRETPIGVAAYAAPLWKALHPQAAEPAPGEILIGTESQRPLAEEIAAALTRLQQWMADAAASSSTLLQSSPEQSANATGSGARSGAGAGATSAPGGAAVGATARQRAPAAAATAPLQWAVRLAAAGGAGGAVGAGAVGGSGASGASGGAGAARIAPIAIGACESAAGAALPGDVAPVIPGLSSAEQAALLQRVERMFAADADTRKTATAQLMLDGTALSDAVPLAVWRARQPHGTDDAALSGVINTLVLLQQASPATLNRERAAIDALLAQAENNGPQTRQQVAALRQLLNAKAAMKPGVLIEFAGTVQRPLAEALARQLQRDFDAVPGVIDVGKRAPEVPELRVEGFSDRRTARSLQAATATVLQRKPALVNLSDAPVNDSYKIRLDRGLCATRVVAGCGTSSAAPASGKAPATPPSSSAEQPTNGPGQVQKAPRLQSNAESLSGAPSIDGGARQGLNQSVDTAGQRQPQSGVQSQSQSQSQQQQQQQSQSQAQAQYVPAAASQPTRPGVTAAGTAAGLDMIARFEGYAPRLAAQTGGPPEIGYGHAITQDERASGSILIDGQPVPWGGGLTEEQARRLLRADLTPAYAAVDRLVTVPLSPLQRDALASFVHSVGRNALVSGTLLRQLNAGNYDAVPGELLSGTMVAGGSASAALLPRREAEAALWRAGSTAGAAQIGTPRRKR